jgi:tetratricopeptide (TPR) repeat protein
VSLEASGLAALFGPGASLTLLVLYLAAHAGASVLVALAMTRFVPQLYPKTERSAFAYFAALGFFLPVLGVLGMLLFLLSARLAPPGTRAKPFELVEPPRFSGAALPTTPGFNRAGIRPVLQSRTAPLDVKLKALLALQSVPSRAANNLIRQMLREPADDMRLLAYGLLDAREKVLDARIHALKVRLAALAAAAERAPLLKELAETYWELIYRGIVQGDLLRHCTAEARRYLAELLEHESREPGAWALQGRLLSLEGNDREADEAFSRAVALGLSEGRVLPYRAELAFRARDFGRVREIAQRMGSQPANALAAIAAYWNGDGRPAR